MKIVKSAWTNPIFLTSLIVTGAIIVATSFFLDQAATEAEHQIRIEQEERLKTFWELLRNKGTDFRIADGKLLAGSYLINGNCDLPDKIEEIFGGTATIFMGDTRVATNVLKADGRRALGTRLQGQVYDVIFREHRAYRGEATILGIPYFTAYDPIRNNRDEIIGVLYVGIKKSDFLAGYQQRRTRIIAGAVAVNLLFILLNFLLLHERARATATLRESEAKYRTLFEASPEGLLLFTDAILDCNEQACRMFGCSRGELLGMTVAELSPLEQPDGQPSAVAIRERLDVARAGTPQRFTWLHRRCNGEPFIADVSLNAVTLKGNSIVQGTIRDVTEQRRMETALRESEARLQAAVENLPFEFWAVDAEGRVIVQNRHSIRRWGRQLGQRPEDAGMAAEDLREWLYFKERAFAGTVIRKETTSANSGNQRWYETIAAPIYADDASCAGILGIHIDITERKETAAALERLGARYRLTLEAAGEGIYGIDREGRITFANPAAAQMLGYEVAELAGIDSHVAFHYRRADGSRYPVEECPVHQAILAGRRCHVSEDLFWRKDGSAFSVDYFSTPIRERGEIVGAVVVFSDITERKRAEDALRQHAVFLQELIDTIPNPVYYKNRDGLYLGCNRAFETFFGRPREQIIGKTSYELAPKALADYYYEMDAALYRTSGHETYETEVIDTDGNSRNVIFNKAIFREQDGSVGGLVGVMIDVTEQRRTEQALRLTQFSVDHASGNMFWVDETGRIVSVNATACNTLGYSRAELLTMTVGDLDERYPRERFAELWRERWQQIKENGGINFETTHRTSSGARLPMDVVAHFLAYQGREFIFSFARDISRRKQAEAALLESEERFHQLFAQNEDAIVFLALDSFDIIDANPAAISMTGFSRDELFNLGPWSFLASEEYQRFIGEIPQSGDQRLFQVDRATVCTKGGEKRAVSIRGKIIRLRDNEVVYCSFRDISERLRIEEDIRETQAKLIHANKMTSLGMLVSGIAHEINNPNNFISFNAGILADAWKDAAVILNDYSAEHGDFTLNGLPFSEVRTLAPRLFAGLGEGSRRIGEIVKNLKEFARNDTATLTAHFDVNRTVQTAVAMLGHIIHRFTDHFTVELASALPPARGKAQQIEQVVINLLTNALQALPDKSRSVSATTAYDAFTGRLVVTISDEGRGMTREVLDKITEPFFSTRLESGGTGLGLSISASIIKEHHGSLEFESTPGQGTTATIRLPASGEPEGEPVRTPANTSPPP